LSAGGFKITHDLRKAVIEQWPNPEVVRVGKAYHCFAHPPGYPTKPGESSWKSRQLLEAISFDGIHWRKRPFIPPDEDTDACHVPQALVTRIDGGQWLYLFYATQVRYKKNDGKYHCQYDRIRRSKPQVSRPKRIPAVCG